MSNRLDPDQARHIVGPDLRPNCLQRFLTDDTIRRQRVRQDFCTYAQMSSRARSHFWFESSLQCMSAVKAQASAHMHRLA